MTQEELNNFDFDKITEDDIRDMVNTICKEIADKYQFNTN